jgi:hypothetical protein
MAITNLNNNQDGLIAPEMDVNVAVRRILAILNSIGSIASGGSAVINVSNGALSPSFDSIDNIKVPTAGTRVRLPDVPCRGCQLIAPKQNSGSIYAGGPSVKAGTHTAYELSPLGMTNVTIPVTNLNQIYIDADTSGDGIGIVIFR